MTAESFVEAELNVRKSSYLPNPSPQEAEDIADAEDTLKRLRAALRKCVEGTC